MSDPLDDFNRRMTAGRAAWTQGPPKSAADSAAQSILDAQDRGTAASGGGSIDFGVRVCAVILLIGIALFVAGGYVADSFREATAMTGLLVVIFGGLAMLVGGGGLVVGCIKGLGSAGGWRNLILAALAALAAWWLSPWLWMMSAALMPKTLMPLAAAALVFVFTGRR
ncbi:hypothetical protein [uncultured Paracoccus sp.]|uniref:hypothetical protein n=1 Tax=uncultured Paracoccus sp. TaxID=189685 RepID=UPI0025FEC935|nr:hypothetical protein [uncultured Paracoccus sp.]